MWSNRVAGLRFMGIPLLVGHDGRETLVYTSRHPTILLVSGRRPPTKRIGAACVSM